jgi:iron complex outermembrane receptor protein
MKLDIRTRLLASTLLVGAAVVAQPAFAQAAPGAAQNTDAAQSANEVPSGVQTQDTVAAAGGQGSANEGDIVVTGSLIKNPNLVQSSPVISVGQDEVNLRQSNVAEEVLRTIPGITPSIGSAVNNGNGGQSFANLRGLGTNRNIVLVDGNRIVPGTLSGVVDLNSIPLALIERTDVLTGGASTTYGADAVSGVVNFITRSDFAGVEVNASNQITEKGDGNAFRTDITIGANFDDGRGNAVFSVGYQQSDPVFQGDRAIGLNNIDSFSGGLSGSGTSVPSRFTLGTTQRQIDPTTGALRANYAAFNFNPYNVFQTPFERFNMFGSAHYEITDGIEVYTKGLFSKNTVSTIIAPSGVFNASVTIPVSNPYLPAAARAQFCGANDFNPAVAGIQTLTAAQCAAAALATSPTDPNYRTFTTNLSRRTTETGSRISDYRTTIFDYRAGIRGDITDTINFDVSGAYGESETAQTLQGYVLTSRVRDSLLATNTATCLSGNPNCVPVNFFGPEGAITPDQAASLTAESTTTVRTTLAQARAVVSGDFGVNSPFAEQPIGFAAGAEYRKYTASQRADSLANQAGELGGAGGAAPNIDGAYDVSEFFGELIAPLITNRPFFHSLTLEGGVRRSHYEIDTAGSPSFNTTTWKVGGSWEPVDSLKIRGNYARAVRAPNIGELFTPVTTALTNLATDPCAGAAVAGNATLRDVCIAQGAPAASIGTIQNPTAGQANVTSGGNVALAPEKSRSYTFGAVFQPTFLRGFSVTADYYHIEVTGAVSSPTPGDLISGCFDNASVNNPLCGSASFSRNPVTGGLDGDPATTLGLITQTSNLGKLLTDGIDLTANYRTNVGFGVLNLSFTGNWTNRSKFQSQAGSLFRECTGYYSTNCGIGNIIGSIQPEFSWNTRGTLTVGPADFSLLWRHIDAVSQEPDDIVNGNGPAFQGAVPGFGNRNFQRIKAADYFDLTTRFGLNDNLDLTITVQNLFDKNPPLVGSTVGSTSFNSGNTYPSTYDALGRRFAVGARMKF